MYNIWQLTSYKTDNFTDNFFVIKDIEDLKNIKFFQQNIIIWWWTNILLTKKTYTDIGFLQVDFPVKRKKIKETANSIVYQIPTNESFNRFITNTASYTNYFNPMFWIPGSIWWAVIGNAGSFWIQIWDFVESVIVFDIKNRQIATINKKDLHFEYRNSNLKDKDHILLFVNIQIPKKKIENIESVNHYLNLRKQKQPKWNSCWSYFKNPIVQLNQININNIEIVSEFDKKLIKELKLTWMAQIPAGWLIEKTGLKWYTKNNVQISPIHANFIINLWTKNWSDIYNMWNFVKNIVLEKFWVKLEEEVRII